MSYEYFCNNLENNYKNVTIIRPGDSLYDDARQVYNRMHDLYPLIIIRTMNRLALKEIISFATLNDIELAIRGGGHHIAGFGSTQGGILLDLSPYNDIIIDEANQIVRISPGARLSDVDLALCPRGYVIPTGTVSDTGIAGLTLGGGIGWLLGTHGFTCENLVGADVLLATGVVVKAEDPGNEDLLWSLRGGGGNFGIVLEFRFQLSKLPEVYCGTIDIPDKHIETSLSKLIAYLENHCPMNLVVAPFLQHDKSNGESRLSIDFCLSDSNDQSELYTLEDHLGPLIKHTFLTDDFVLWQSWSDDRFSQPMRGYWKSICLDVMEHDVAHRLLDCIKNAPGQNCSITIEHLNPSNRKCKPAESALPITTKSFGILFSARWPSAGDDQTNICWVKDSSTSLADNRKFSSYSNYTLNEDKNSKSIFSDNGRLIRAKKKYDPNNLFRRNHNILAKPTSEQRSDIS
ncbi:FAD-binding protein [Pseudomonas sp. NFX98]|uniref:FAD-dependent oxidoreductase n=1 Tax=Pseudomonas sp. NFX98 TaxID=3399122 RepID=UPI0039FC154A